MNGEGGGSRRHGEQSERPWPSNRGQDGTPAAPERAPPLDDLWHDRFYRPVDRPEGGRERAVAPVLAGRDEDRVREQAELLGASWRTVSLDSVGALAEALSDIGAVVHAAGPFLATAPPMLEACLRAGTHYLDVSGELPVFQEAFERDAEAVRAGVMLMPGAAWSVVATDCLAAHVAERLPAAKYLRLGMTQSRLYSRGTARSAFGLMSAEVIIRRNGRLTSVPDRPVGAGFRLRRGGRTSMALSWPDALSAYHTTGIPNIEAYMEVGAAARVLAPLTARIGEAFQLPVLRPCFAPSAALLPEGPAEAARKLAQPVIVAEVEDGWRRVSRARLRPWTDTTLPRWPLSRSLKRVLRRRFRARLPDARDGSMARILSSASTARRGSISTRAPTRRRAAASRSRPLDGAAHGRAGRRLRKARE